MLVAIHAVVIHRTHKIPLCYYGSLYNSGWNSAIDGDYRSVKSSINVL